jgi:uncharacterized protein YkwD
MRRVLTVFVMVFCGFGVVLPVAQARSSLSRSELSLLQAVNAARTTRGLAPLRVDPVLERAARSWSAQLLASNVFTHGAFAQRMRSFHVRGPAIGENLGWGSGRYATAQSMVRMWLSSPAHRANLLRAGYRRIGIGTASGTFQGESGAVVATADFAGR